MSFIKKTLTYFSFIVLSLSPLSAKEDYQVEIQPVASELLETLPNHGILKQKDNGFVYLDVSNEYISDLSPLLEIPGMIRPSPTASRSIGAHISVFDEKENIKPLELGETFSFDVKEIRSFTLHTRDGLKKLWVIAVQSTDLENLREKYGCSSKLKGYDFHITLGKQLPTAPENWESVTKLSDFNFSDEATEGLYSNGSFYTVENDDVIQTAAKIDAVGQLCLKSSGYAYVDVSNDYIDKIWSQIQCEGDFEPLSTKAKKMGAHISVLYEDEMIGKEIWELAEAGEWFTFEVKELRYIDRSSTKGKSRLWLLAVDAPGLERLRKHYGLKPKLLGHDFHITIGNEAVDEELENLPDAA